MGIWRLFNRGAFSIYTYIIQRKISAKNTTIEPKLITQIPISFKVFITFSIIITCSFRIIYSDKRISWVLDKLWQIIK